MNNNSEYYLNNGSHSNCPQIPSRQTNYLDKTKYLSEFLTEFDKEVARYNLGITELLDELNNKIDTKVIERGNVAWDLVPTEGNTDKVLSSNALYNAFLNYATTTDLDHDLLEYWTRTVNKIEELYNIIENEINNLNDTLTEAISCLRTDFNSLNFNVNLTLELILTVSDEIYQRVKENINDLLLLIDSLEVSGIAVSNHFGSNTHISISQKTITEAINKIWLKIEDMTGEVIQGFDMQVTPKYYIGETGANIHIEANTVDANGMFEHIAFYGNGQLIAEADNVDFFEYDFHINETTVVQCVAKIMGVEYTRQDIITHYSSFLLGSGDTYEDLMDGNNRFLPQYVIPITNGMRGAYDVNVAEGKRIIIAVGESLREGFIRADLNGVEIHFIESTATDADGKVYTVFTSEPWSAGEYNIDING